MRRFKDDVKVFDSIYETILGASNHLEMPKVTKVSVIAYRTKDYISGLVLHYEGLKRPFQIMSDKVRKELKEQKPEDENKYTIKSFKLRYGEYITNVSG